MQSQSNSNAKTSFFTRHKKYFILLIIIAICFLIQILTRISVQLSDFMNFGISNAIRGLLALITSIVPFSLGETVVLILPFTLIVLFIFSVFSEKLQEKLTFRLCLAVTVMYSLFVLSFAPAYGTTSASKLFGIEQKPLSADDLYSSASILKDKINLLSNQIDFDYGSFSNMNYDYDSLTDKLLESYDSLSEKYSCINNFKSRLKPITLSEPMTYTHISGVYTYYTGESNINTNFPDYTIPYTSAHEMAHQRGFARENEANFVAFLVCDTSDDPYIRYSGYLNMLEYILNALYSSSPEMYVDVLTELDVKVRCDMAAYSEFFDKYRHSKISDVAGTINDTYLKSQGMQEGEKSYGLVIDLSVAYILNNFS